MAERMCGTCRRRPVEPPARRCDACKAAKLPFAHQVQAAALRRKDPPETAPENNRKTVDTAVRWCAGCQHWLIFSHFGSRASRCRGCQALDRNGGRVGAYGIGMETYQAMLEASDGCCYICGLRPRTQQLAVDHNHLTGEVRGLLCGGGLGSTRGCNHVLLPAAAHDPALLRRAADYLEMRLPEQKVITQVVSERAS